MKSISTLVPDIQRVLVGELTPQEKDIETFSAALAGMLKEHLGQRAPNNQLRMSNWAQPDRKLWYTVNQPDKAEPLPPETKLKFLYGYILEHLMLFLAKVAGHDVKHEQKEVELHGVPGHIDAVIDGVVTDVKSANGRSFAKFRDHLLDFDDPFGYRDQLSLYVASLKDLPDVTVKKQGAFLAVDKELGNIALDTYKTRETDYERETIRKRNIVSQAEPPSRCYTPIPDGKSGNLRLGVECSYCAFKETCWSNANGGKGLRKFIYSNGPRWLVHVEREPDVPESINGNTAGI